MSSVSESNPEVVQPTAAVEAPSAADNIDLAAPTDRVHVRIFHTNDCYEIMNLPRVKAAIQSLKLEDKPGNKNISLMAGDFLAPSVLSFVDEGACMIDCMNETGFDFVTLGNHEQDVSMQAFVERIKESKFPWLNTNMINFPDCVPEMPEVLRYTISTESGHSRTLGFLGLLCNDPALYKDTSFWGAKILPVTDTAMTFYEKIKDTVDNVIPITHQFMPSDRITATVAQGRFPVIIGGHDHSPYMETVCECPIIKTGMDAHNISVVDLIWESKEDKFPDVSTQLVPVRNFAPDADLQQRVNDHTARLLAALQAAQIMTIPANLRPLTSKDVRTGQKTMGTFLLSMIRDGMLADCAIFASGSVRRGMDYPEEHVWFNFCDLVSEMPFQDDTVVVDMPGKVISDTLLFSRTGKKIGTGAFMQHCSAITYVEGQGITHINGEPLVEDKTYRVVCSAAALDGVDENIPLLSWRAETGEGPLAPKPAPKEGSPDRLLQKTALIRWSARNRAMENLGGRQQLTRKDCDDLYAGQPEWFKSTLFNLLDMDADGVIGVTDLAIVACTVWVAQSVASSISIEELKVKLEALLGEKNASEALASILQDAPETTVLTRQEIGAWVLRIHDPNNK